MNWRQLITSSYEGRPQRPGIAAQPRFHPAASGPDFAAAESALHAALPAALRSLLLETNGVMEMMAIDGGEWFESLWIVWSIGEIVEQNRYYRTLTEKGTYRRDFRNLVIFAAAGTDGILFAFPAENGVAAPQVQVWHPIMDELNVLAPSLEDFLRGWLTGTISV